MYADFSKAYDKIDHFKLLEKLKQQFGISGKLGKWIKEFLHNRKQQVLILETKSKESKVASGSIQGSVLGPVLFLMYIRDLSKNVKANIKIFVEDTKMKNVINDENDVEELQANLDRLFDWQMENNMQCNGAKFQLLRYCHNEDIKEKNSLLYRQL